MAALKFIQGTRGLQKIWLPEQGLWLMVWCHDDGDIDVNHRLSYMVCSSPSDFIPANGQFILVKDSDGNFNYVYGVPYAIESYKGIVKVSYTDLNIALGWPRMATDETEAVDIPGKDPTQGYALEGHFLAGNSNQGPVFWNIKDANWHNNPGHVLEATDITAKTFHRGDAAGYSAPTGTIVIEYQRDKAGRIKVDKDGFPLIALIDPTLTDAWTAQNFKIGYLGLSFQKDYYGLGIHGWIGSGGANPPKQFDIYKEAGDTEGTYKITLFPGTVNGMIPSNMFTKIPYAPPAGDTPPPYYVFLSNTTNGRIVTGSTITISATMPPVQVAALDQGPADFVNFLGILVGSTIYQMRNGPFDCALQPLTSIPVSSPSPGSPATTIYYRWDV